MSLKPPRPEGSGTPRIVQPFLHVLDRMQDRAPLVPEALVERAIMLLTEAFGTATVAPEAAFSHGVAGLMSEHTHYFPGFALLMPIHQGTAVAVRPCEAAETMYVLEGSQPRALRGSHDTVGRLLAELLHDLDLDERPLEIAVVRSVPDWWLEAGLVSLGVAAGRALQALVALSIDTAALMRRVSDAVARVLQMPFSVAYPLAADVGRPGSCVLVDTEENETMALPGPSHDMLAWGAVQVGTDDPRAPELIQERIALAERGLTVLRRSGFPNLGSYRDLEHRDLERALDVLTGQTMRVVRYLVTENRRVQKMVVAVRRSDWQLLGALLLMSHAVQRDDWGLTTPAADRVVGQVEAMSIEGLYGARSTGRGATVLLIGQTFVVPAFLDRITDELGAEFETPPETLLL